MNLPLLIQMGELDSSYDRNKVAAEYSHKLKDLQSKYPGNYLNDCFIHYNAQHSYCKDNYKDQHPVILDTH